MAISKIILNGVTQMDLTSDTVAANNLISPNTAHDAAGLPVVGTASGGGSSEWTTLVDQNVTIYSGSPNYFDISNYTTAIGDAEQYRVTWGDSSHVYISKISLAGQTYDGYFYGNSVVIGSPDDGSGLSVLFYRSNASTLVGVTTDTGTKYLKIEKNVRSLNFQAKTNISPSTSSQIIPPDTQYDALSSVQINAMPTGTEGTPSATKGTVSNHSVSVTPSVTNTTGWIAGSTKTGTAVTVSASELVSGSETKTENGTYDVTNLASLVVNVPSSGSSKNAQISNTTGRATSSTYTAVGPSITVAKTGTYDVYWTGYRSSTSGTNGSQLYIGSTAYGSAQTTFNTGTGLTNTQNVHLSNVSLTQNQVLTIRARSRGNNYYMYVQNLVIIEA